MLVPCLAFSIFGMILGVKHTVLLDDRLPTVLAQLFGQKSEETEMAVPLFTKKWQGRDLGLLVFDSFTGCQGQLKDYSCHKGSTLIISFLEKGLIWHP